MLLSVYESHSLSAGQTKNRHAVDFAAQNVELLPHRIFFYKSILSRLLPFVKNFLKKMNYETSS